MEVIMAKTKVTSGGGAPDEIEASADEEKRAKEPTATPVAGKWSGLIPAAVVLGLIALAILLSFLTE
jgi:hypothetical protein